MPKISFFILCLFFYSLLHLESKDNIHFMGQAMFSFVRGEEDSIYGPNKDIQALIEGIRLGITVDFSDYLSLNTRGFLGNRDSLPNTQNRPDSILSFEDSLFLEFKNINSLDFIRLGRIALPGSLETSGLLESNPNFISNSMLYSMHRGVFEGAYFSKTTENKFTFGLGLNNGVYRVNQRQRKADYPFFAMGLNERNTTIDKKHAQSTDLGYLVHMAKTADTGAWRLMLNYFSGSNDMEQIKKDAFKGIPETKFLNLGLGFDVGSSLSFAAEYIEGRQQNFIRSDIFDYVGRIDNLSQFNSLTPNGRIIEDDFKSWFIQAIYSLDPSASLSLRYGVSEIQRAGQNIKPPIADGTFDDSADEITVSLSKKVDKSKTLILEYSTMDYDKNLGQKANQLNNPPKDNYEVIRASFRIDF